MRPMSLRISDTSSSVDDDSSNDSNRSVDDYMQSLPLCPAEIHLLRNGNALLLFYLASGVILVCVMYGSRKTTLYDDNSWHGNE